MKHHSTPSIELTYSSFELYTSISRLISHFAQMRPFRSCQDTAYLSYLLIPLFKN